MANPSGTGATFRARSSLACLVTTVALYGVALGAILIEPGDALRAVVLLGAAVVAQIVALIVVHAVIAARCPAEPDDERDTAIDLRASRLAHRVLLGGIVMALIAAIAQQVTAERYPTDPAWLSPLWIAHLLVAVLVVGEASYHGAVSWSYRRDG